LQAAAQDLTAGIEGLNQVLSHEETAALAE
jgi:hypothetical protein